MKKIIVIISLCFCSLMTAFAQKMTDKTATVVIEPIGKYPDSVWVMCDSSKSADYFFIKPDVKGRFVMKFRSLPVTAAMGAGGAYSSRFRLPLKPGDDFCIRTDFGEQTTFSGKGYEAAEILYRQGTDESNLFKGVDWNTVTANDIDKKYSDYIQRSLDNLEAKKSKLTADFYKQYSNELIVNKWYYQLNGTIQILNRELGRPLSASLPDNFWDRDKDLPIDDSLLKTEGYGNLIVLTYPLYSIYRERFKQGLIDSPLRALQLTEMAYKFMEERYSDKIRSYAMGEFFQMAFDWVKNPEEYKFLIENYLAKYALAKDAEQLKLKYGALLQSNIGQIPPTFVMKDTEGKDVTLKDFEGKVVYMDFWASWCSPCRYEMQNGSPKLHQKFKDNKDVVFLYVSIDDRKDLWKQAIDKDKIEGIHTLSAGGFKSSATKALNIRGVPHYMIIGRDGKIFDNNAPRPSQNITIDRINQALAN